MASTNLQKEEGESLIYLMPIPGFKAKISPLVFKRLLSLKKNMADALPYCYGMAELLAFGDQRHDPTCPTAE